MTIEHAGPLSRHAFLTSTGLAGTAAWLGTGGDEERDVRGELVGRGTEATDSSAGATGTARVYGRLISVFSLASAASISSNEGTSHKRMRCSGSRR